MTTEGQQQQVDVLVENHGSIFVFQPLTQAGRDWIAENIPEPVWFGGGLCVEHRYAGDIAAGMQADGLVLK